MSVFHIVIFKFNALIPEDEVQAVCIHSRSGLWTMTDVSS